MKNITIRQVALLSVMYLCSLNYLETSSRLSEVAKQHGYVSYVLSLLITLVLLWVISRIIRRFSGRNVVGAMIERYPIIGRCIAVLFMTFLLLISAGEMRACVDFINSSLLNRTPLVVIGLIVMATVIIIAQGGIRSLVGIAEIYVPILILAVLMIVFTTWRDADIRNLQPFLPFYWRGIFHGFWVIFSSVGQLVLFPLILSGKHYKIKGGYTGLLVSGLYLIVFILMVQLVVGIPLSAKLMYPTYEIIRQVQVTDFMDRFDLLLVALWLPTVFAKIGFNIYLLANLMQITIPGVSGRLMVAPMGVLSYVCGVWFFKNPVQQINFNEQLMLLSIVFEICIPLLLFFALWPRRKKRLQSG
ncbi:MAG TPA: endospore germination permease [Paenibacillus sp.]